MNITLYLGQSLLCISSDLSLQHFQLIFFHLTWVIFFIGVQGKDTSLPKIALAVVGVRSSNQGKSSNHGLKKSLNWYVLQS